jgi:hypothetical protein
LRIVRKGADDHGLAREICQACVEGLDVDGAAISVLIASPSRETLWATDATAELLEDLQFTLNEGAWMQAATCGCRERCQGMRPPRIHVWRVRRRPRRRR